MARPRSGSLVWNKSGWRARLTVEVEGEQLRQTFDLGTTNKPVARRKLTKLVAEFEQQQLTAEQVEQRAQAPETVDDYANAWLEGREARGVRSVANERRWWRLYWRPAIGHMPVAQVKRRHIKEALVAVVSSGGHNGGKLSRASIHHMRGVALRIFEAAVDDELLDTNPVAPVKTRTLVDTTDETDRPRTILTDDEFRLVLACPEVDLEIKMLVLLSRTIGGMRAGDLNALDWTAFDEGFATCVVPRCKTRRPQLSTRTKMEGLLPDPDHVF